MEEINEEEYKIITKRKINNIYEDFYNDKLKLFIYAQDGACLLVERKSTKIVRKNLYIGQVIIVKKIKNYFYINEEIEYIDIKKDNFCEKKYMVNKYKYKFKK